MYRVRLRAKVFGHASSVRRDAPKVTDVHVCMNYGRTLVRSLEYTPRSSHTGGEA
jgi:hypothetical protein